MRLFSVKVSVTLLSPFLIGGNDNRAWNLDAAQIRDQDGHPIIPHSHLRGMLRHAARGLAGLAGLFPITEDGLPDTDDRSEKSARLILSDLVADGLTDNAGDVTRVSIDSDTGTAKDGHLLVAELVAPVGLPVLFVGHALLWANDDRQALAEVAALNKAARLIAAMGRYKTVGWGEVQGITLAPPVEEKPKALQGGPIGAFDLTFGLDRAVLVDPEIKDSNTVAGRSVIPGAAIKGALAEHLRRRGHDPAQGALSRVLAGMVIGHSVPGQKGPQQKWQPLVAVAPADIVYRTVVKGEKAATLHKRWSETGKDEIHDFSTMWVFETDLKGENPLAYDRCDRTIRTRVKIDEDRQAAADGKLFTQTLVCPKLAGQPVVWRARIVPPEPSKPLTPEYARAWGIILNALFEGPATLGKSNARMTDLGHQTPDPAPAVTVADREVRITLRTAALMIRQCHLSTEGAGPALTYDAAIAEYWRVATAGTWTLRQDDHLGLGPRHDMFVRTSFRGGFTARAHPFFGAVMVEPFVLTDPGSVFCLVRTDTPGGETKLMELEQTGLPAMEWTATGAVPVPESRWEECPFLPQNGYGAFSVEVLP